MFSLPKEWNVKELEFENCTGRVNRHKIYDFPQRLFTCEMLVVLKLRQCVDLDYPGDTICFPNLKVLHLEDNTFKYHDSASKLINSCCPILEELDMRRGEWDDLQRLVIASHTLKRLTLSFLYFDGDEDDLPFETVIDVPALEYLDLQDWTSKKFVLGDFGSLIKATVDLNTDCAAEVFRNIHNVKKLCLLDRLWHFEESLDLPIFHYLTRLKFSSSDCGNSIFWTLILESLSVSPILEKVYFENVNFVVGEELDLTSEQAVPHCLSSSLKTCEFGWLNGDKNEVKVIGYFLKNSKVLKHMTIWSFNPENINKQAISALSRGSSACKIYYRRNQNAGE